MGRSMDEDVTTWSEVQTSATCMKESMFRTGIVGTVNIDGQMETFTLGGSRMIRGMVWEH